MFQCPVIWIERLKRGKVRDNTKIPLVRCYPHYVSSGMPSGFSASSLRQIEIILIRRLRILRKRERIEWF